MRARWLPLVPPPKIVYILFAMPHIQDSNIQASRVHSKKSLILLYGGPLLYNILGKINPIPHVWDLSPFSSYIGRYKRFVSLSITFFIFINKIPLSALSNTIKTFKKIIFTYVVAKTLNRSMH